MTCRAACTQEHLTDDPLEPPFGSCLATSCATACGFTCGEVAQFFGPDAAAGCQACIVENACSVGTACAANPDCLGLCWCTLTGQSEDRNEACGAAHDAGRDAFTAARAAIGGVCASPCAFGNQWSCVGHAAPRTQTNPSTTMALSVFDLATGKPLPGSLVEVCSPLLPPCTVQSSATTGADGGATVTVPTSQLPGSLGATGYLKLTGGGAMDELFYWVAPLSEPSDSVQVGTLTSVEVSAIASVAGVTTIDPTRAAMGLIVSDCNLSSSPGATVTVDPKDSETRVIYSPGAAQSATALATDATGVVAIVNVPVGPTGEAKVTVTPAGLGRPSTVMSVFVAPNTATALGAVPNQ